MSDHLDDIDGCDIVLADDEHTADADLPPVEQ